MLQTRWDEIAGTIADFTHHCVMVKVVVDGEPTESDDEQFSILRQEWTYKAFLALSQLDAEVDRLRMDESPEIVDAAEMIDGAAHSLHRFAIGMGEGEGDYDEWRDLLQAAKEILRAEIRLACGFPGPVTDESAREETAD